MKIQIQCERYRTGFRVFPFLVYTSSLTGSHSLKLEGEFNVLIYKLASFIVFYNQFFSEERRSTVQTYKFESRRSCNRFRSFVFLS